MAQEMLLSQIREHKSIFLLLVCFLVFTMEARAISNIDYFEFINDLKSFSASFKQYTYNENGIYNILATPGKYTAKVTSLGHKNATMIFFVPPQDSNLRLPETNEGIEGINRFTFLMKEGNGDITLEENIYIKVFTWCPILVYIFSLIGIWGSFITYKRQSYKNAQIGAFFSVMAMGFLVIGPILGIMALYYLKKHKKIFTASFKN